MRYAERKYTQRIKYLQKLREQIRSKGAENLVYLDESGFDPTQNYHDSGWAKIGQKIYGDRSGKHWQRTSLLMAKNGKKCLAPYLFSGTCDTKLFNAWLEQMLIPELSPNQTIIMDNARIHKNPKTREILEKHGHELLYLPPYSPDFNPIEQIFGVLKRKLKNRKETTLDQLIVFGC